MMPAIMHDYWVSPPVHIFADTEAALAKLRAVAEAADCRILTARAIGSAGAPEIDLAPRAALLLALDGESGADGVAGLLDWIAAEATPGARRAVVSVPLALLDAVAARLDPMAAILLCAPDEADWSAALAELAAPAGAGVRDRRDGPAPLLLPPRPGDDLAPFGPAEARQAAAFLRAMLRARRLRDEYFRPGLFADPVWDVLLDLMAARLEGTKVSVSSLCVAAAVPPTTALRWINRLTAEGLLLRDADAEDRRRVHLGLSEQTARAIGAWLRRVRGPAES